MIKSLSLLELIAIYDQFSLSLLTNLLSTNKLVVELARKRTGYTALLDIESITLP